MTDEAGQYGSLKKHFTEHDFVTHGTGEYVRGDTRLLYALKPYRRGLGVDIAQDSIAAALGLAGNWKAAKPIFSPSFEKVASWRALPTEFGNWNSTWKRFWRLSRSGVFEAFLQLPAETSKSAHVVQFYDSTVVRPHASAAGAKGGRKIRHSAVRGVGSPRKSTSRQTLMACPLPSI